jgi:Integrase core domain
VFTGLYRGRGWVALERGLTALGIALSHCRPYHPQTCGKAGRFHQTLKKRLARHDPATTVSGLQAQRDAFTACYNTAQPHRAIGRRTLQAAWNARPAPCRQIRASASASTSASAATASTPTASSPCATPAGSTTSAPAGAGPTPTSSSARDLDLRIITHDNGKLIRQLTLDPSQDYQPQAPRV